MSGGRKGRYGFSTGGIELPASDAARVRPAPDPERLEEAVRAGRELGYRDRNPSRRLKPGPRRTEEQGRLTIPGPVRVIERFRKFCVTHDMTLWRALEYLLAREEKDGR